MSEYHGLDLFDFLLHILRRKRFFLLLFVSTLFLSYAAVYLLVEEEYDSSATIVSVEDESMGLMGGLLRSLEGLPLRLGGGRAEQERFNTIVYSRGTLENVIGRFGLYAVYGLDSTDARDREAAVKRLRSSIRTTRSTEAAYTITCSAPDPILSSDITNYVVHVLNQRVVDLRVNKARENRIFLEARVDEIQRELGRSEDSLKAYQQESGMLEVTSQVKELLSVYTKLESELMARELQLQILESLQDPGSPQAEHVRMEIKEFRRKLDQVKAGGQPGSVVLAMHTLPETSLEFLRRFREVEIGNLLLKFLLPLREQSRIEEKKESPILQVIDGAVPPARRSFPPRVLLSLGIALFVSVSVSGSGFLRERLRGSRSEKIQSLRTELQRPWKGHEGP
ncbi:MAG: hypothetical protein WD295_04300 [Bacteroidota bacterium]